jgi:hypothetical protein
MLSVLGGGAFTAAGPTVALRLAPIRTPDHRQTERAAA